MSQAAKRAAELTNACQPSILFSAIDFEPGHECGYDAEAFRKFIQHVSDVAKQAKRDLEVLSKGPVKYLDALILPHQPDPLVGAIESVMSGLHYDVPAIERGEHLAQGG